MNYKLLEIKSFFMGAIAVYEKQGLSDQETFDNAFAITKEWYSKEILYRSSFETFEQEIMKLIKTKK